MTDNLSDFLYRLNLTPYQICVIEQNCYKYNLAKMVKQGNLLYAPYRCNDSCGICDFFSKVINGPRADLIGADRMLIKNQRGIKIYNDGCFKALVNGECCHGDAFGNPIKHSNCIRVI